jgi:flavodoxin
MNVAIVYESLSGNTKEIAQEIEKGCRAHDTVLFLSVEEALKNPIDHKQIDLYFLGSWTNKGNCGDLIRKFAKQLNKATVALFQTAGYGNSTEYFKSLEKRFIKALPEDTKVVGTFHCQGKMPLSIRNKAVALLQSNPQDARLELNVKNFDSASTHPNRQDLSNARMFAQTVLQLYDAII